VQGDIIDQLDRLSYIQSLELSVVPTPELEEEMRNAGTFGEAAASLARADGGRRAYLRLSGDKRSERCSDRRVLPGLARGARHRPRSAALAGHR
jgi:hypothetical protein